MSSYHHLPEDIMENILSRLPVKSIKRFRCVCKHWYNLFRNPDFINMHYNRGVENENFNLMIKGGNHIYSFIDNYCNPSSLTSSSCLEMAVINYPFKGEYSTIFSWGACNGLFCLIHHHSLKKQIICIWNPSTKEYKKVLPPNRIVSDHRNPIHEEHGLGYDCNIGDYKLVFLSIFIHGFGCCSCHVQVYTLGSNSWKHIPVIYPYGIQSPGVLVDGTLHWVATFVPERGYRRHIVVSFDFGVERFMEVPMPEHLVGQFYLDVSALEGCLCIYGSPYSGQGCFEVWVMKDYGVRESWTKLFDIAAQQSLRGYKKLIQPFKNDEYLLYVTSRDNTKDSLVVYNPKKERVRALKFNFRHFFNLEQAIMTYLESLVSLDTGTYVVQERVAELEDYDENSEDYDEKRMTTWFCCSCFSG